MRLNALALRPGRRSGSVQPPETSAHSLPIHTQYTGAGQSALPVRISRAEAISSQMIHIADDPSQQK